MLIFLLGCNVSAIFLESFRTIPGKLGSTLKVGLKRSGNKNNRNFVKNDMINGLPSSFALPGIFCINHFDVARSADHRSQICFDFPKFPFGLYCFQQR